MGTDRTAREVARKRIVDAAVQELTAAAGLAPTMDQVASAAGCAKGLVHYHFRTKDALLAEAAGRIWADRGRTWREALSNPDPSAALAAAWSVLTREARNGRTMSCLALGSLPGAMTVQSARAGRSSFSQALGDGLAELLDHMGRSAAVPPSEIATLLASVADGLGIRIAGGDKPEDLEPAWSAFWAAVLSLTRPG
jgi:AcrR family transcriptional regulator